MKILSVFLVGALLLTACDSGPLASADAIRGHAIQSLEQKNYSDAAKYAKELSNKTPDSYEGYFLLAQACTQLGDRNAALAALETAIKKGLKDDVAIAANANLQALHPLSAYTELMDSAFPKREKPVVATGDVGISTTDAKTVIRAGDVVVEMPKD